MAFLPVGRWRWGLPAVYLFLVVLSGSRPSAASCVGMTAEELEQRAEAIFHGRVTAKSDAPGMGTYVHMEVLRVLKGHLGPKIKVWQPSDRRTILSIDVNFQTDHNYLVFINRLDNGRWTTNSCAGTRPMAELTAAALTSFDMGPLARYLPGQPPDPSVRDAGTPDVAPIWLWILASSVIGSAVLGGLLLWRFRRYRGVE